MDKEAVNTHTMEYYLATKKKEIQPSAIPWMVSEGVVLSEISHTETYQIL